MSSVVASGTTPRAQLISSPSACLQGNFRDGHEHRYAAPAAPADPFGPARSATIWYGRAPDPAHDPQTSSPALPVPLHTGRSASRSAVRCDAPSGASPSTCSKLHRAATSVTLSATSDNPGQPDHPTTTEDRGHWGHGAATRTWDGPASAAGSHRAR